MSLSIDTSSARAGAAGGDRGAGAPPLARHPAIRAISVTTESVFKPMILPDERRSTPVRSFPSSISSARRAARRGGNSCALGGPPGELALSLLGIDPMQTRQRRPVRVWAALLALLPSGCSFAFVDAPPT